MTHLTDSGTGAGMLWVVSQDGIVRVFQNDPSVDSAPTFLDITGRVEFNGDRGAPRLRAGIVVRQRVVGAAQRVRIAVAVLQPLPVMAAHQIAMLGAQIDVLEAV